MSYVIFARWFGIVSVALALGMLFNLEDARDMAKSLIKSDAGYIMGGVLPVIFGSLSLMFMHDIQMGWDLVVIAVGAFMFFAGLYRVIFVAQWKIMMEKHVEQIPFLFSLFGLMLGVILLYVGFVAGEFAV